jgi:hypothetical protein
MNTKVLMEDGIIRRDGDLLIVDKNGVIKMIRDNSDKDNAQITQFYLSIDT